MDNNNFVVIMAGGIGSRFWPSSRKKKPKQFLDILGLGKSFLQLTFERFAEVCPASNIFIVTNLEYKKIIQEQLPVLTDNQILTEPSRNDTAPCITYAAMKIRKINPNANFVVAPSDHIILKEDRFVKRIKEGLDFVKNNEALLTLGIQPQNPNTGYGYIHFDKKSVPPFFKVQKFTEKPNIEKAEKFVASGEYLWNAGIFVWNVNTLLNAIKTHAEDVYKILDKGEDSWCTSNEQAFLNEYYPTTPSISIDYAIMEKADNIYTIPADIGWSDLGTWGALHQQFDKDENNNAISSPTPKLVQTVNTNNCMLRTSKDKLVVIKDLEDYIVVDEENVLLIYPKDKEQEIKQVSKELAAQFGDQYL
ncbi:MAG: mannose-1-phosphate guanylyltransferase [Saprospiraceae bacterium]|nr:mannose-1-phosphate guanylyltransferase [Saprospiraceae bacterium]